ncbi:class I SAM-dependent methyltransferase [Corynebacterium kalidii]|uniref:Class I SAM-dependent methyltransferase n=1 Tax=Corynebacterium kalidii TaxID=2931982 RepID=A0A9X2B0R6_9CORY|nr:class I SAM-dependent methyltransferase [Corynebacterium kalidii]MCJ7857189.1 class I SAM-dependent methyltransferase [Corynebacterium kalidii]
MPSDSPGPSSPSGLPTLRRRATLRRSLGLLSDFRFEQSDPDRFYGHLAEDTVGLIADLWNDASGAPLHERRILDVGGGPGYFGRAFAAAGVHPGDYVTCEPDVGEMAAAGIRLESSVRGSGMDLPFADGVFDVAYSSNVAEHVPDPWRMADEMLRVTRPGGLMVFSYTCWLGPFGGHETGLWEHYVGGEFAARRYEKRNGHPPKNRWGESLFNVSCNDGLRYAREVSAGRRDADAEVLAAFPRYHPWWAWWMVRVPGLREVAVSNLVLVLRKRATA